MANNAAMYDVHTLIQAGIDPKTKLPIRMTDNRCNLKGEIKKQLRILDEQNAVNRFVWYNLPKGLTSDLIERVLYYRGQGALFRLQDKFYFLPYALSAPKDSVGIDCYGRFTGITPLPFNGTSGGGKEDKPWINGLIYKPVYDPVDPYDFIDKTPEEVLDFINGSCILLHDYTPQISQTNIPRQLLQDPLLDIMSDCFPYMRTALMNSTGVMGLRVGNEIEQPEVDRLSSAINDAALNGKKYVGITGTIDFQELTGNVAKAEEFLLAMQALDNYRLSLYGLDNGGLFQKKSHLLEAEQEMNSGNTGLVAEDGLRNRQRFCDIFNSIFAEEIDDLLAVAPSECTLGIDRNGDAVAGADQEPEIPATQSNTNNEEETE